MKKTLAWWMVMAGLLLLPGQASAGDTPKPDPFVIGKARITALQDTPGSMELGLFRGETVQAMQALVPSNSVPSGVTVFLIQLGGRNVLVDAGSGLEGPDTKSALPELLRQVGLESADIHRILLTHMHSDHIGGLVRNGEAVFPKADVLVSEKELAFWTDAGTPQANPGLAATVLQVREVQKAYGDRLKTFAFGDTIAPEVTASGIVGHTPGHAMFSLASGDDHLLFWGDLVHGAALQFANPDICAIYDMDMPQAVKTRQEILKMAADRNIPVAGAHLPFPAIGRVSKKEDGGGYTFKRGL